MPFSRYNYLYGAAEIVYPKHDIESHPKPGPLQTFHFDLPLILKPDRHDITIKCKATPDKLVILAGNVYDRLPLPKPREWSNFEVVNWIEKIGFPQYRNTFRVNLINGRTLLLIEASQLIAMNIKNFDHIQKITSAIRKLYKYEFAFFARSISLAPKPPDSHYKDYRIKNGISYDDTRATDLFRIMHIIGPKPEYDLHFRLLEKYLEHNPPYEDRIGQEPDARTKRFYKDHDNYSQLPKENPKNFQNFSICNCMPPCQCAWKRPKDYALPWILKPLRNKRPDTYSHECRKTCKCVPPCSCGWENKHLRRTFSVLVNHNPRRYHIDVKREFHRFLFRPLTRISSISYPRSTL